MNVFHKRPLALILCISVGGFAISTFSSQLTRLLLVGISVLLLILGFLKIFKSIKPLMHFSAITLCLSILCSSLYFELYFRADKKYSNEVDIVATVEDTEPVNSYTTKLLIKTSKINGDKTKYLLVAYLPTEDCSSIICGRIINLEGKITKFHNKENRNYNYSNGISASIEDISDIQILGTKEYHLKSKINYIREFVSRYTIMLSDSDSGSLLTALLLGDRDKLSPDTRLDFKRIGISHILALSGLHLAILSVGIEKLLSLFSVKKKARIISTGIFVILYMAFTGFSVSVVRAGIMLILSSALFLLSKSKDSITSLCMAVFLICVFTPYAVYDIALWLSAFATLGIIVLAEYYSGRQEPEGMWRKALKWFTLGILSSVFAIGATFMISALSFGHISLLGIVSTIIFSALVELIMYLGCIMILLGWILPVGKLLSPLCSITVNLARMLSSLDFIYLKCDDKISVTLIELFTLIFFGFIILNIKRRERYIAFILSTFVLCFITTLSINIITRPTGTVTYHSSEKSDDFVIISKDDSCFISSAQYSKSRAYNCLDILDENKITSLDHYYFTHYSMKLEEEIDVIVANIKVKNIHIPAPQNEDEERILAKLKKLLDGYSIALSVHKTYEPFEVGSYKITPLYCAPYGEETSMNSFSVSSHTTTLCYISSGLLEGTDKEAFENYIKCSDQVILGCHGKKYKNDLYIGADFQRLSRLVINSPNVFMTQETLEKYDKNGCDVMSHPLKVELIK